MVGWLAAASMRHSIHAIPSDEIDSASIKPQEFDRRYLT